MVQLKPPARPKIYHITHVDNLTSIITNGAVLSDAAMMARGGPAVGVGMSNIKQRRLSLPIECHKGSYVGEYVPFYFCPRSIMLYVISRRNHSELLYTGGQEPILHLEADLHEVIAWADANQVRWAFSLSNAGAMYTQFRSRVDQLDQINWQAVAAADFRPSDVKEGKQAEFLLHGSFPWFLVSRIGAYSIAFQERAAACITGAAHRPTVVVQRQWYY
jgi:hypothetical protein